MLRNYGKNVISYRIVITLILRETTMAERKGIGAPHCQNSMNRNVLLTEGGATKNVKF